MEDLSKLLKDAPRGMKLYSPLFGEVTFGYVSAGNTIWVTSSNGKTMLMFTRNGKYCLNFHSEDDIDESAECLLFPSKDCRAWEGWKPPVEPKFKVGDWIVRGRGFVYEPSLITEIRDYYICELINGERVTYTLNDVHKNFHLWTIADAKEGDVLVVNGSSKEYKWIGIFKALTSDTSFSSHCHYNCGMCEFVTHIARCTKHGTKYNDIRPATNEERDLLFAKMQEAGYQWDADKKELRKIIEPSFKVGDWITDGISKCQIHFIDNTQYWYSGNCILGSIESVNKRYHLWTIQNAKDGDVLALNGKPFIYSHNKYGKNYCYIDDCGQFRASFNLVFEGNCVCPATKQERDLLFSKMREAGYEWDEKKKELRKIIKPKFKLHDIIMRGSNLYGMRTIMHVNNEKMTYGLSFGKDIPFSEQDLWHLANSHYFINNFKPFQKVLVRQDDDCPWRCDLYSHKEKAWFFTTASCYLQCIPFEGNEKLVGTTKPCAQEYVNW